MAKFLFLHHYIASCVQKDDVKKNQKPRLLVINFGCLLLEWPGNIPEKWGKHKHRYDLCEMTLLVLCVVWGPFTCGVCTLLLCLLGLMGGGENSWCGAWEDNRSQDTTDSHTSPADNGNPVWVRTVRWGLICNSYRDLHWLSIIFPLILDFFFYTLSWLVFLICKA